MSFALSRVIASSSGQVAIDAAGAAWIVIKGGDDIAEQRSAIRDMERHLKKDKGEIGV